MFAPVFRVGLDRVLEGLVLEHGHAGFHVQVGRRLKAEHAGAALDDVGAVEQRDDGEFQPPVGHLGDVDDCGAVVGALDRHVEPGAEHGAQRGHIGSRSGIDVLDEDFRKVDGLREGDDAAGKHVLRREFDGADDVEPPGHIGHELLRLAVVLDVVADEVRVLALEFEACEVRVALVEFLRAGKFALRCRSDLEPARRIDLLQLLQQPIRPRLLGVAEDVKTPEPAGEGDADEQEDEDRPEEEIVPAFGSLLVVVVSVEIVCHAMRGLWPGGLVSRVGGLIGGLE